MTFPPNQLTEERDRRLRESLDRSLERSSRVQTDALARVLNKLADEWETSISVSCPDPEHNALERCVRQLRAVANHGLGLAESDAEAPRVDEPSQVSSDLHVVCTVFFDDARGTGMSVMSDDVAVVWTRTPARVSLCGLFVVRVSSALPDKMTDDYLCPLSQERNDDWPSAVKGHLSMSLRRLPVR